MGASAILLVRAWNASHAHAAARKHDDRVSRARATLQARCPTLNFCADAITRTTPSSALGSAASRNSARPVATPSTRSGSATPTKTVTTTVARHRGDPAGAHRLGAERAQSPAGRRTSRRPVPAVVHHLELRVRPAPSSARADSGDARAGAAVCGRHTVRRRPSRRTRPFGDAARRRRRRVVVEQRPVPARHPRG